MCTYLQSMTSQWRQNHFTQREALQRGDNSWGEGDSHLIQSRGDVRI